MTDELIKTIANNCIDGGWEATSEGSYIFYFDELAEEYGVSEEEIEESIDDILDYMYQREEVLEEIWTDDGYFDINFCFDDVVGHATFFSSDKLRQYLNNDIDELKGFVNNIEDEYGIKFKLSNDFDKAFEQVWKIYNNHLNGEYSGGEDYGL